MIFYKNDVQTCIWSVMWKMVSIKENGHWFLLKKLKKIKIAWNVKHFCVTMSKFFVPKDQSLVS